MNEKSYSGIVYIYGYNRYGRYLESCLQLRKGIDCKEEINLFNDPQKTLGEKSSQAGSRKGLLILKWNSS